MAMIEYSIHLLLQLIAILLILLALCTLYLIINRKFEVSRENKVAAYKKVVLPEWIDYLNGRNGFSRSMIPVKRFEIIAVEEILISYMHNFRGPDLEEKICNFANHHMASHYKDMLHSLNWSVRMNALYRIVDFRMDNMIMSLERLETKKLTREERFQLLKFKSIFSKEQFIHDFIENNGLYSEYELKKLLIGLDPDLLTKLISRFDELVPATQYTMIDIIGYKQDSAALPFIETKILSSDPECRIRSLKALFAIGVVRSPEMIVSFTEADHWEERLMAAKLLKYVDLRISYPYLQQLMGDPSWWVRSQAARTFLKFREGKAKLQEFIRSGQDRYAIDMAIEALAGEEDELG